MSSYDDAQRQHYSAFLATADSGARWDIALAAARLADEHLDARIGTAPEGRGRALDELNTTQQAEVMRRASLSAGIDPTDFGAAVFDEAHDVLDELRFATRHDDEHARAYRVPVLTAQDIDDCDNIFEWARQRSAA